MLEQKIDCDKTCGHSLCLYREHGLAASFVDDAYAAQERGMRVGATVKTAIGPMKLCEKR